MRMAQVTAVRGLVGVLGYQPHKHLQRVSICFFRRDMLSCPDQHDSQAVLRSGPAIHEADLIWTCLIELAVDRQSLTRQGFSSFYLSHELVSGTESDEAFREVSPFLFVGVVRDKLSLQANDVQQRCFGLLDTARFKPDFVQK